jgi:hypothetical protein
LFVVFMLHGFKERLRLPDCFAQEFIGHSTKDVFPGEPSGKQVV